MRCSVGRQQDLHWERAGLQPAASFRMHSEPQWVDPYQVCQEYCNQNTNKQNILQSHLRLRAVDAWQLSQACLSNLGYIYIFFSPHPPTFSLKSTGGKNPKGKIPLALLSSEGLVILTARRLFLTGRWLVTLYIITLETSIGGRKKQLCVLCGCTHLIMTIRRWGGSIGSSRSSSTTRLLWGQPGLPETPSQTNKRGTL